MPATMEMAVHISDPALVAQGVIDVSAVSPLVMAYACTSGSFVGGPGGRAGAGGRDAAAGAPAALTTSGALLEALRHLDITRIATATPYTADLTVGLTAFLGEAGIEVTAAAGLGLISDIWTVPHDVTAATGPRHRHRRRRGGVHQLHQHADLRRDRHGWKPNWASRC